MPRPRKSKLELYLHGGFRKDRHGSRLTQPEPTGKPVMPRGMPKAAQDFWRRNITQLIDLGIATDLDQDALAMICHLWAEQVRMLEMPDRPKGWVGNFTALNNQANKAFKYNNQPLSAPLIPERNE